MTLHGRPSDDSDLPILLRVADGDVESFGILVQRHQDRLWRLCERMLGDPEEAREATQDVFLKAFQSCSRFDPRAKVFTWLYRIAVNHCLNRLRRRRRARFFSPAELSDRTPESDREDASHIFVEPGPDAERLALDRARWSRMARAIDSLPVNQRAVLTLVKLEGLSYRQAAEALSITEGAVESRLVRAMRRLSALRDD